MKNLFRLSCSMNLSGLRVQEGRACLLLFYTPLRALLEGGKPWHDTSALPKGPHSNSAHQPGPPHGFLGKAYLSRSTG